LENAIHTRHGPLVLLFYDGFELPARPGLGGAIYSQSRRVARYLYRSLKRTQVWTGFYAAFKLLHLSLLRSGCDVRINDFSLALRHPSYPIGMAGYPSVLSRVELPNPVIFGPGDYGLPDRASSVAGNPRFRKLIQPCEWAVELYRSSCGDKMMAWPVGIDTDRWRDSARQRKDVDVLVYDKIRWHRDRQVPHVLDRVTDHLRGKGLSFEVLRYGEHHYARFAGLVRRSRALLFLCEHETQGIAYQEAMASNVPVLAWDEGVLVDPMLRKFVPSDFRVTTVPYFDARCGERFTLPTFETTFSKFWSNLGSYRPRQYILENLSLEKSAQAYLSAYSSLLPAQ
jgi:hypothetical protein